MFSWLSRIRVQWKVFLTPALLMLLLVGTGAYSVMMLSSNQVASSALVNGPILESQRMQEVATQTWETHGRLYRVMATAANETDTAKIESVVKEMADHIATLEIKVNGASLAPALQELLVRYVKQARNVLDMADTDSGAALMLMMTADRTFGAVDRAIEEQLTAGAERRVSAIARAEQVVTEQRQTLMAVVALALIVSGLVSLLIGRDIALPLRDGTRAMVALSEGRLQTVIPGTNRRDELGEMGRALEVFKSSLQDNQRLQRENQEAQVRAVATRKTEMQALAGKFESAVGDIVKAVSASAGELEKAATTLSGTASSSQQRAAEVAAASARTSSNVQSVASATEQLGASVDEISRQVHESSAIATEAVRQAGFTNDCVTQLSTAATRVGGVVDLITSIAKQTNLLALNATIEAARAGEAGKGFAVVAQEVKALAAQTANATDEIGAQIATMQQATGAAITSIREIGDTINRIAAIAGTIAAAVEQQGAATREIASNVQEAAHGTTQVASSINDVHRSADETGSASAQVLASARYLAEGSGRLSGEVETFLATVRAG